MDGWQRTTILLKSFWELTDTVISFLLGGKNQQSFHYTFLGYGTLSINSYTSFILLHLVYYVALQGSGHSSFSYMV